jgi:hypothetical protein
MTFQTAQAQQALQMSRKSIIRTKGNNHHNTRHTMPANMQPRLHMSRL